MHIAEVVAFLNDELRVLREEQTTIKKIANKD
jgi:hypothetical protein